MLGRNFVYILFLNVLAAQAEYRPSYIVKTNDGFVKGFTEVSLNGSDFIAFEGIPYAKPPVGDLRFRDPVPITPWKGVLEANVPYNCLQYYHYTKPGEDFVKGEEDCLYLNIYVPLKARREPPLDVIIFIHGGAFMFNNARTYGAKGLLAHDEVIFASMYYRLGPLGFLSTEDKSISGNMGLKDQIMALKWIKDNIHHFNGNPNSITVSGMSAGGASVQIHTMSPLSKGIFHKALIQSGTALNPWVLVENSLEKSVKLCEILGCPTENGTLEMVNCLRQRPAKQIVGAVKHFQPWLYNPFSPFGVVVDKWSENPVLPNHPYVLLKYKQVENIPTIFSNVASEGLYPVADFIGEPKYLEEIKSRWDDLVPFILDYNNTAPQNELKNINKKIKEFYFGALFDDHLIKNMIKMVSDRLFIYNIVQAAKLHSAAITENVYYYFFSHRGANSKSETMSKSKTNYGASHGDDTVHVLSSVVNTRTNPTDTEMSLQLTNMWLTLANKGVASIPNTSVQWPPLSKNPNDDLVYLEIKGPFEKNIGRSSDFGNGKFWKSLGLLENERLFAGN